VSYSSQHPLFSFFHLNHLILFGLLILGRLAPFLHTVTYCINLLSEILILVYTKYEQPIDGSIA
jgi:hypothetical protein